MFGLALTTLFACAIRHAMRLVNAHLWLSTGEGLPSPRASVGFSPPQSVMSPHSVTGSTR